MHIFADGKLVSRSSDYIIYSVEAAVIESVVALYGRCTSPNFHESANLLIRSSNERRCDRWRPDLLQRAGNGRIQKHKISP